MIGPEWTNGLKVRSVTAGQPSTYIFSKISVILLPQCSPCDVNTTFSEERRPGGVFIWEASGTNSGMQVCVCELLAWRLKQPLGL